MPHNGCPHQCSFCDQKSITGQAYQPTQEDVKSACEVALNSLKEKNKNAEIAFFGGSFTAIDREYMLSLLDATKPYIDNFYGIRLSTRPDYIDDEVLSLLKSYKVTSIELGAQSMCDDVLFNNDRGHTADDVRKASKLIHDYGFSLSLQMMTGLYTSNDEKDIFTAQEFIKLSPEMVRIYPTITMKNTRLSYFYDKGEYKPQTLENCVNLCAKLLTMFEENNISVIRLGLHHSDSLIRDMVAGPYHPSFRELCESKILLDKLLFLADKSDSKMLNVRVNPKCVSKLIGNEKSNIKKLKEIGYEIKIIQDEAVSFMDLLLS